MYQKISLNLFICLFTMLCLFIPSIGISKPTEIWIIRHGEKPVKGYNLTCQGLNRSLSLPNSLYSQMGEVASKIYVPKIDPVDGHSSHARMFETAIPYAVRFNVDINSNYKSDDFKKIINSVDQRDGKVIMIWNHSDIPDLAKNFGIKNPPEWNDNDFDSIWIINPKTDSLQIKQENIYPSNTCPI